MPGAGLAHVYRARPGCWVVSSAYLPYPIEELTFNEAVTKAHELAKGLLQEAFYMLD